MLKKLNYFMFISLFLLGLSGLNAALPLEISDFGGFPDGSDTTPALNAAIEEAKNGPSKTIRFDAGNYSFHTPPNPTCCNINLVGEGKSATVLKRTYSEEDFLIITSLGGSVKDLTIWAAEGTSGGIGLHLISSDEVIGGNQVIENVWITGKGTWLLPLYLNGSERTKQPLGIRDVRLDNVMVFNGTWHAVQFWNCIACEWFGGGVFEGFGTTDRVVIGGPDSQLNRLDVLIDWGESYIWKGSLREVSEKHKSYLK